MANPPSPPNLLNDDGSASMATAFMMSHHGFRRDIARFAIALRRLAEGDHGRASALQQEWQSYHATLHGHHTVEDTGIFPNLRQDPALKSWRERNHELARSFERILLVDSPLCPFRTGRQPSFDDRTGWED